MPVRSATFRAQKYEGKIDADAIKRRIDAHADSMKIQERDFLGQLAEVEMRVKRYIEQQPGGILVRTWEIPFYINFGRQCWSLQRKFEHDVALAEIQRRANQWVNRNLNATLLVGIAALFGKTISAPTPYGE